MLLRVRLEDRPHWFPWGRQIHLIDGVGAPQEPRDDTILAFIDGRRRVLAAHRAVDGLDRHLPGERWGIRFPRTDLPLAALSGRGSYVERLPDGLIRCLNRQAEERPDPGRGGGSE